MHILQIKRNSSEIISKELHDSLIHISHERPRILHFLYFISYIVSDYIWNEVKKCQQFV